MNNYGKSKIRLISFCLFVFLIINSVLGQENVLRLAWTPNNETHLSHYVIYRDTEPGTMRKLDHIQKPDSTYADNTVQSGVTYYYKLSAADSFGLESPPTGELVARVGSITSIEKDKYNSITTFKLEQNYPNPFNNTTKISFSIEKSSWVVISIFDALGREIKKVKNSFMNSGKYQVRWDGTNQQGEEVATGIYYYQLMAESFVDTKKLIIQK